MFTLKPPTVEPNYLSFDGGGIRGIVALTLLQQLQKSLSIDVRQFFDYYSGSSAGAESLLL